MRTRWVVLAALVVSVFILIEWALVFVFK